MIRYIYIMCDSDYCNFHVGHCKDVPRMINFYKTMPTVFMPPKKQNILIYLEILNQEHVDNRFHEVLEMKFDQKVKMITDSNPTWVELVPGGNIDL